MTFPTRILAAAVLIAAAAVLPAGSASAAECRPPSAERAFEELLDVADDGAPVEHDAWRIADEQEARGAFETATTIQRLDTLARANGFVYNCTRRTYLPQSGPDPREAIENGEEPPETGDTPAATPGPTTSDPKGGAPAAAGSDAPSGPAAAEAGPGGSGVGPGGAIRTSADSGEPLTAGGTGEARSAAPHGQDGVVLLPDEVDGPMGTAALTGLVLLAAVAAGLGATIRAHRRRTL
jgi:hypothetical protein